MKNIEILHFFTDKGYYLMSDNNMNMNNNDHDDHEDISQENEMIMNTNDEVSHNLEDSEKIDNADGYDDAVYDHEAEGVISSTLDDSKKEPNKIVQWAKNNKPQAILAGCLSVALLIGGGALGVNAYSNYVHGQAVRDVVEAREGLEGEQQDLPRAKVISGSGRGTLSAIDNQNGKKVTIDYVGVDAIGPESGATLIPPENVSIAGWYVRSAPFGVDQGTSIIAAHVNGAGRVGAGSLFLSMKKDDPITITDSKGVEHHYIVTTDPVEINKQDPEYIKKTSDTINRSKGKNALVLVSCSGQFDPNSPLGYSDNTIVEAHLVD